MYINVAEIPSCNTHKTMLGLFVVLLLSVSAAAWRHQSHAKVTVTTTVYVTVSTCVTPTTSPVGTSACRNLLR